MDRQADDFPRKQTEFSGSGNGPPPRPTATGLADFDRQPVPDISTLKKYRGVVGTIVVGHDGLLLASDFEAGFDEQSIGIWALGVYMNTEHVIKKFGHSRLLVIVANTPKGHVIIADCGSGLLATICDDEELMIPLMKGVTKLLARKTDGDKF